jgi:hypothetical protein
VWEKGATRQGREIWEAVVAEANCLTNLLDGVEFDPDVYGLSVDVILKAANKNRSSKLLDKYIKGPSIVIGKAQQLAKQPITILGPLMYLSSNLLERFSF